MQTIFEQVTAENPDYSGAIERLSHIHLNPEQVGQVLGACFNRDETPTSFAGILSGQAVASGGVAVAE